VEVYDAKELIEELRRITQLLARQNELLHAILDVARTRPARDVD
jgi:hypothetical protein